MTAPFRAPADDARALPAHLARRNAASRWVAMWMAGRGMRRVGVGMAALGAVAGRTAGVMIQYAVEADASATVDDLWERA